MDLPLHPACRILKEADFGLLAIDKAEGVLSHPNKPGEKAPTLLKASYDPEREAYVDGGSTWFLLNRLDAPTSGVILLSADREVAGLVRAAFVDHAVKKCYAALIRGIPVRKQDIWRDYLETVKRGNAVRTTAGRGRSNSETKMELLERGKGPPARALIALYPMTGRTHQLRVQCASRRHPIIGDATYGDFSFNREYRRQTGMGRLFLHSWKTELTVQLAGRSVSFSAESPVPETFAVALQ